MNRLFVVTGIVAILIGLLVGYLWWGLPHDRLQAELRGAQANAERAGAQLDELRTQRERLEAQRQQLETQLKAEASQREAAEVDLRREKEKNARLQGLFSRGRK